jgi:hypothetical protein
VGAPSHAPPATDSGRADGASYDSRQSTVDNRQPGQQLDQSAGDASNESSTMGGDGRLQAERPIAALHCGAQRRRRSQSRRGGPLGGKRGGRQEQMTERKG